MSKIEDFKSFVKENPKLINHVKENKMTWQKFYEMYDLYGSNNEVWNEYLKETPKQEEKKENKKLSISSFNDIINMAKNMDVDKVQEGITSLQKAIALFSDLFVKSDTNTPTNNYTPRPIYRSFED